MVAIPVISQFSPRAHDEERSLSEDSHDGSWGPLQIAAPIIVGVGLLLAFTVYIIWQRRPPGKQSYSYHPVRSDWVTKIPRIFVPRRRRCRLHHSSDPITLDDSMRSGFDVHPTRPYRSDSSDSQTPLTTTTYPVFDYPSGNVLSESPPPISRQPIVRWWWLFGSRPQEVKPKEPGLQWRVDGADGSSTGHGSHGHEDRRAQHAHEGALAGVPEDPREEVAESFVRIGGDFTSTASTPLTQHFPEQVRTVRGMPTISEGASRSSSGAQTPAPVVNALLSGRATPDPSAYRGFPPSYDDSQTHRVYSLEEDPTRSAHTRPYMASPPPVRMASYTSPRTFHGRDLSSDSFLAAQPPMVVTSMY